MAILPYSVIECFVLGDWVLVLAEEYATGSIDVNVTVGPGVLITLDCAVLCHPTEVLGIGGVKFPVQWSIVALMLGGV